MNNHRLTNVTAIMTIFVVLLLSGASTSLGSQTTPSVEPTPIVETIETQPNVIRTPMSAFDQNMKLAFDVGSELGHPETLQAILLVETRGGVGSIIGGKQLPALQRSYGIMQIQVGTARSVLQRTAGLIGRYFPGRPYKSISNEEIIRLLLTSNEASMRIAAHNFQLNMRFTKGNWERAVAAYNAGIGAIMRSINIPNPGYVGLVKAKMKNIVRPYNTQHDLLLNTQ